MIKIEGCAMACWYIFNSWLGGRARGQKTYNLWILPISLSKNSDHGQFQTAKFDHQIQNWEEMRVISSRKVVLASTPLMLCIRWVIFQCQISSATASYIFTHYSEQAGAMCFHLNFDDLLWVCSCGTIFYSLAF